MRQRRRSPWGSRVPVTISVICTVLLLGFGGARPAAAQSDDFSDAGVDGNQYESPTFGYSLEWDEDTWTVADATSDERDGDTLELESDDSTLHFEGYSDFDGDAAECLNSLLTSIEENERVAEFQPIDDESGDEIAGEVSDRAFQAYSYILTTNGDDSEVARYTECVTTVSGESVLQIDLLTTPDTFDDELAAADDVIDSLVVLAEAETGEDTDSPNDEDEPTEEATEESDDEATEAATEEDEDEPTEEATEEATKEATEESDDEDAAALPGVDGNSYTSPSYEYSLAWDDDLWTIADATSEDDVDTLILTDDVSTLTITGTGEFGENLDRCLRIARQSLEDLDDVTDIVPAEDADGNPIEIDEDDRVGAVYQIFTGDTDTPDQVAQVECRVAVPGDAVIQVVQIVDAEDFNAEIDPVKAVLDTITLADEASDDGDTGDDENGDNGDRDVEALGVDGNTYLSPGFGYSLEWDEDVWTFDTDNPDDLSSDPGFDFLFLSADSSGISIIGTDQLADPQECLDTFVSTYRGQEDIDDWQPLEDENGDRVEGDVDRGVFAAFTFTASAGLGTAELAVYFECRSVVEDQSVIALIQTMPVEEFEAASEDREDLVATLTFPDEDDSSPGNNTDDSTDSPDEEATEPTDPNANLDSYTDPDFPFTVTWDENVWSVADQRTVADGHNLLNLQSEEGDLTIEGWARWDGDPSDCLNDISTNIRAIDGVQDFQRVTDSDRYPEGASSRGANALFSFTLAPEGRTPVAYLGYVECRTVVEGEAVVLVTLITPTESYESDRSSFEAILRSIQIEE